MCSYVFRKVRVIDPRSEHHDRVVDILVENGKIQSIETALSTEVKSIDLEGKMVSLGFRDLRCILQDPGYEFKSTFEELCQAASVGGFTQLTVLSGTKPSIQTAGQVTELLNRKTPTPVQVTPFGAATHDQKGEEMVEYRDLLDAGAAGFFDSFKYQPNLGLIKRILEYLRPQNGLLTLSAFHPDLGSKGQMHEGEVSTHMGLPGYPVISEHMAVQQILDLLEYTGGRVHFSGLSTERSVRKVAAAKKEGKLVSCDVPYYLFCFTDEDLAGYDTNLKVYPPIRDMSEQQALLVQLKEGAIDAISSGHYPQDIESKDLEFDLASNGMLGLESMFTALWQSIGEELGIEQLVGLLTNGPDQVLDKRRTMATGQLADLVFFDLESETAFTKQTFKSTSKNSPFLNKSLKGRVSGVCLGEHYHGY